MAPSLWLLEVNPRPPGISALDAVESVYGIDYVGIGLLFPLEEKERIKALSIPFAQGPQHHCQTLFILADKGGIFDSDDPVRELQHRRPDLGRYISSSVCYFRRGDKVRPPSTGSTPWIFHIMVVSRIGRAHLLEVSELIRQNIRFTIL